MSKRKELGQSVVVRHRSDGDGKLEPTSKAEYDTDQVITAIYMDGSVRLQSGDVWQVAPSNNPKYDWMTIH